MCTLDRCTAVKSCVAHPITPHGPGSGWGDMEVLGVGIGWGSTGEAVAGVGGSNV